MATLIRESVKKSHPGIITTDLKKYSVHSVQVWACVLLDEAGKSLNYIRKFLC
jgi:hypothetical protein